MDEKHVHRDDEKQHGERLNKDQPMVSLQIDGQSCKVLKGSTLATAITQFKGIGYRHTRFGDNRGPVCNMGVCFECSVFLEGRGNIRACMIEAQDGMVVHTEPNFEELPITDKTYASEKNDCNDHQEKKPYDVAIIGAGPTGLATAEELSGQGLRIVIVDEQENAGGQIYRHVPESLRGHPATAGKSAWIKRIREETDHLYWIQGRVVWSITPVDEGGHISVAHGEQEGYRIYLENHPSIWTRRILIATGAYDRMYPFKGWTLPGVMSAGGLQIFAKSQNYVPGQEVLLAGSHPFLLIVAQQIIQAGGTLKGIAFSQGFPRIGELFSYGFNGLRRWKKSKELIGALQAVRKAKVPIWFNRVPIEAEGTERVNHVKLGRLTPEGIWDTTDSLTISCDAVGLCYGFVASSELARQLGCETRFDEAHGGWLVHVNEYMETTVSNVWVAGELTGIGGAELSEIEGRIAGLTILKQTRLDVFARKEAVLKSLLNERVAWQSFAQMLGEATQLRYDFLKGLEEHPDTYVCRCEEVSYENLMSTIRQHPHVTTMNAIKLMTRCGMGLCQGRYCEQTLQKATSQYHKMTLKDALTTRFPVKPVTINQLIDQFEE